MKTDDLLAAIAGVIAANRVALGLEGVSYPALPAIPASPWAMVRQSVLLPTTIEKARAGVQIVRPMVDIVVLVASDVTRPGDAARLDGLTEPILDLFDANAQGGNVNAAFDGLLTESVDHIWHEAQVRRAALDWGEAGYCHAAILTMDSQFSRKAQLPRHMDIDMSGMGNAIAACPPAI